MAKTVDHNQIRNTLLLGVVKAGAKYGLTGITNQTISETAGLFEAYIYRYFEDRDDLIRKAFLNSDKNFFETCAALANEVHEESLLPKEWFGKFMNACWGYISRDYDYSKFYTQFYYSAYMTEEAEGEHHAICRRFFKSLPPIFSEEMNPDVVLHLFFTAILSFSMNAANGYLEPTEKSRNDFFEVLWAIISPYIISEGK